MANYEATSRSNYFKVKNPVAFKDWVDKVPGLALLDNDCGPDTFGVYPKYGDWPIHYEIPECLDPDGNYDQAYLQEEVEINWVNDLGAHLADGEVCVMMSVVNDRLRYVCDHAIAFGNTGKTVSVSLEEIYAKAKQAFGVTPTVAEY